MKRLYFLPAACLLLALPLSAQENLKNENLRTLSADSILTGDARMDSLYRHLPEVMVVGERPVRPLYVATACWARRNPLPSRA